MGTARRALVTGSAGGIGRAIAETLAAAGHEVIGVDRRPHEGPFATTIEADLSTVAACDHVLRQAGEVDVLVNNASVLVDRPLEDTTIDDMQLLFDVNLRAPVLLTRGLLPGMARRGWGRVVNLSSVGARTGGMSQSAVYNMTKAGIASFTRYVARHYGPDGVTANAIAPGAIESGMTAHFDEATRAALIAQIPARRMASPAEVAAAAAFLASDAAAFINGITLDINGGWVMA